MTRRVAVVPHTHWDREWYLPFETYRARLVTMLDELLPDLAEADMGSVFLLDGQMAVIDDYLAVRPAMEPAIRELVQSGRLLVGPWYVLPDEFLVSGETLFRNLEMGRARGETLGGAMQVGYLPDMFGHIAQMPQILARFGFDDAVVWRGVPAALDRTGFWWQAPDGSQVRAEYLPQGYGNGSRLPADATLAVDLIANFEAANEAMLIGDILWMHGGDHQAPTPALPERIAALNAAQDRYELFLTSLPEYLAGTPTDGLASWSGELRSGARSNLLMGVVSNRVDIRRVAGEVEYLLEKVVEPIAALLGDALSWPGTQLDRAWHNLVLNSAHDSICACSLDEVCRAVVDRYATARQIAEGVLDSSLDRFAARLSTSGPSVVNPSRLARSGLVEVLVGAADELPRTHQILTELPGRTLADHLDCAALPEMVQRELDIHRNTSAVTIEETGQTVEVTVHADGDGSFAPGAVLARLRGLAASDPGRPARVATLTRPAQVVLAATPEVPSYGWAPLRSHPAETSPVEVSDDSLDNGCVRVDVDTADGSFAIDGCGGLGRLVDSGDVGDTYNYCPPTDDELLDSPVVVDTRVLEPGPLRARLEFDVRLGDLLITTTLELRTNERFVRRRVSFENTTRDHRLRELHTLPGPASTSVAGCAFASVARGLTAEGGPTEMALATYPARDFVSAGRLTIAAQGAFEYELVDSGSLAITLVRSTGWLSRGPMASRPLPAGPEIPLEDSQVQQTVSADHILALDTPNPFDLHEAAFAPLLLVHSDGAGTLPDRGSAVATSGAVVSAVRVVEDTTEVRAFNPSPETVEFEFGSERDRLGPWEIRTLTLRHLELAE